MAPVGYYSKDILDAYYLYISQNCSLISRIDLPTSNTDEIIQSIFKNLSPETQNLPIYMRSLQAYLKCNKGIVQDTTSRLFGDGICLFSIHDEILYWADTHFSDWLGGKIDKRQLFNGYTTHHFYSLKKAIFHPRRTLVKI